MNEFIGLFRIQLEEETLTTSDDFNINDLLCRLTFTIDIICSLIEFLHITKIYYLNFFGDSRINIKSYNSNHFNKFIKTYDNDKEKQKSVIVYFIHEVNSILESISFDSFYIPNNDLYRGIFKEVLEIARKKIEENENENENEIKKFIYNLLEKAEFDFSFLKDVRVKASISKFEYGILYLINRYYDENFIKISFYSYPCFFTELSMAI